MVAQFYALSNALRGLGSDSQPDTYQLELAVITVNAQTCLLSPCALATIPELHPLRP